MTSFFKWSAALLLCALTLSGCKPSSSPASAKASASTSALQPSFSGQYDILTVPQPTASGKKIEVLEFFGYFCSHCRSFDPVLTAWARKNDAQIVFKRIPIAFRDSMITQQRMYYALEAMGKLESLHTAIFRAVQDERQTLSNEEEIVAFLEKQGVDKQKFVELYRSPDVQAKAAQAKTLQSAYQINSVPTVGLAGRYLTSPSHAVKRPAVEQSEAGLQTATLAILDELLAKSIEERRPKP